MDPPVSAERRYRSPAAECLLTGAPVTDSEGRLLRRNGQLASYFRPFRTVFPEGAEYQHDQLHLRAELSDEQKAKAQAIMDGNREAISGLFSQLRAANDELAAKLLAPGPVAAADLAPTLGKIAGLRQKLVENGASVALQIRGLMSPEQIAKASQVRQRLEQLDEERRQLLGKKDFGYLAN